MRWSCVVALTTAEGPIPFVPAVVSTAILSSYSAMGILPMGMSRRQIDYDYDYELRELSLTCLLDHDET